MSKVELTKVKKMSVSKTSWTLEDWEDSRYSYVTDEVPEFDNAIEVRSLKGIPVLHKGVLSFKIPT